MGNRLCKKKGGEPDAGDKTHPFDRLINRLHLKPTSSWKSDPQLTISEKQTNRSEVTPRKSKNGIVQHSRPLSNAKSSDWTEASLEVPENEEVIHLKNPQLSLMFNNDTTPTPPPRKHKKTLREKLETAAKNGLQALQAKKIVPVATEVHPPESPKPVEEPPFIKKTVIYGCPLDDHDHLHHNRNHKHPFKKEDNKISSKINKDVKRKKNLSVVSLPNINEFRFSIKKDDLKRTDSGNNLVENPEQKPKKTASTGKLESYVHRCRSIGSIFPQKVKHKNQKSSNDVESDDSFGGLEDWDCKILEHYKPKDASLQRPRRPLSEDGVLSDVEKLIVSAEEFEKDNPPVRPIRRSESLIKDEQISQTENSIKIVEEPEIKRKRSDEVVDDSKEPLLKKKIEEKNELVITKPPAEVLKRSLLERRVEITKKPNSFGNFAIGQISESGREKDGTKTPPPTPVAYDNKRESVISISKLTTKDEQGNIEHSSLIKLLHEYSKNEAKEKQEKEESKNPTPSKEKYVSETKVQKNETPLNKTDQVKSECVKESSAIEDFLNAERKNNSINVKSALDVLSESKCEVIS